MSWDLDREVYANEEEYKEAARIEAAMRYEERMRNTEVIKNNTRDFKFAKGIIGLGIAFAVGLGGTHIGGAVAHVFENMTKGDSIEHTDQTKIDHIVGGQKMSYDEMKEYYANDANYYKNDPKNYKAEILKQDNIENQYSEENTHKMSM